MNQSIHFPDGQIWSEVKRVIEFKAMQSGMLIECSISITKLKQLSDVEEISGLNAIKVFEQYRFDIEELAEEMIEEEQFNHLDQIEIN